MKLDNPSVFIIILNWNGWQDTVECIKSLQQLDYQNYKIVVVDNASVDDSLQRIREHYPGQKILECEENMGFAGGNNVGIRYALDRNADYVWLLNNDTVVDSRALSELINRMGKSTSIGICGSKLIYYHQRDTVQALGGGRYNKWLGITTHIGEGEDITLKFDVEEVEDKLDYIVGASMMASRLFLEDIGLLSEDYFLYYEEVDWAERAGERYQLSFAKKSIVYHKEGASIKSNNQKKTERSRLADYYQIKNRLKFTWKYYPWMIVTVYISVIMAVFNRILRGQWGRVWMILKLLVTFNRNEEKKYFVDTYV